MNVQESRVEITNLVCGYTCQDHLLLDLDDTDHYKAYRLACMIQREWPALGVGLLVRSSKLHYHIVYDKRLTWERLSHIIETLAALGIVEAKYAYVRTFRRDLTLRVSPKNGIDRYRPAPEPVGLIGVDEFGFPEYGVTRYLRVLGVFKNLDAEVRNYGSGTIDR